VSSAGHGFAGPYRLLKIINTGQTSQVWQAYHDATRKYVAVKTLQEEFARDREHVNFLKWEYSVASKIEHERICRVYKFGRERGIPYLGLEWFAAPNLKIRIQQSSEVIRTFSRKVAIQATEAVAEFCRHGWVHRDIKPDNFLVDDEGTVKLIDFGLANKAKKGWARFFARKSKVQGTRSYMSPEQIRGKPLDERADLYSLGCTIFEMFSSKPPYTGLSANDLLMQHITSPVPWLKTRHSDATDELSELLQTAMAKVPERRQDSIQEFLAQLRSIRMLESAAEEPKAAQKAVE
jgi:serine/threonine protein kinase